MFARLLLTLALLCSGVAQAGYSSMGQCFSSIQEAVSKVAYYHNGICMTGDCRILSYVPTSGTAQVISQGLIVSLSVSSCESVDSALPTYILPTPWYGSDPGTVSACGSTVNTSGGVSGTSGGTSAPYVMTDAEKLSEFQDGAAAGMLVFVVMIGVWGITVLRRAL